MYPIHYLKLLEISGDYFAYLMQLVMVGGDLLGCQLMVYLICFHSFKGVELHELIRTKC